MKAIAALILAAALRPTLRLKLAMGLCLAGVCLLAVCGCSRQSPPETAKESSPPPSAPVAPAAPDPDAPQRAQLLTRVAKLTDKECDDLVLEFQLIPRDEIMEPLSKPRNELVRYVKRNAMPEDLGAIDRALRERKK